MASSRSRSTTPEKVASSPIGSSRGATPAPNFALRSSRVRENEARSRSSLFTKIARGMFRSSARRQATSVCTSTPSTADTTKTARSAARSAAATSPTKSAYPGESRTLILWPSHSNGASASDTEILRRCSSGSKSVTAVPSSTLPIRGIAPATKSSASARVVFPAPPWPTRATLRTFSDDTVINRSPRIHWCWLNRRAGVYGHSSRAAPGGPGTVILRGSGRYGPLREGERTSRGMLDGRWRAKVERGLDPVGRSLHRSGISADGLTIVGLVVAVGTGLLIANGNLLLGVIGLVLTGLPDILDGSVARYSGKAGPRGAFFDSVSDRVSDAAIFLGVAWHLTSESSGLPVLAMAVLGMSMLITYERAKAEALGYSARGGLMERAERMVLLGVGLAFDVLVPVLWVMLALTALTAVHRFVMVWRQASSAESASPRVPSGDAREGRPVTDRRQRVRRPRSRGLSRVPGRR